MIAAVRGDVRVTRWRIDADPVAIDDPAGRIDGKLFLRATLPLGLRGEAAGHWRLPDERVYRFAAGRARRPRSPGHRPVACRAGAPVVFWIRAHAHGQTPHRRHVARHRLRRRTGYLPAGFRG
jgi:hypothetical protein